MPLRNPSSPEVGRHAPAGSYKDTHMLSHRAQPDMHVSVVPFGPAVPQAVPQAPPKGPKPVGPAIPSGLSREQLAAMADQRDAEPEHEIADGVPTIGCFGALGRASDAWAIYNAAADGV